MVKSFATYGGNLYCEVTHEPSRSLIQTDAPVDNGGKGQKFSPTDLLGAALSTCILTTMAIVAERSKVDLKGSKITLEKHMRVEPRRVGKFVLEISLPDRLDATMRKKLETTAHKCPVAQSLSADIETVIRFSYVSIPA